MPHEFSSGKFLLQILLHIFFGAFCLLIACGIFNRFLSGRLSQWKVPVPKYTTSLLFLAIQLIISYALFYLVYFILAEVREPLTQEDAAHLYGVLFLLYYPMSMLVMAGILKLAAKVPLLRGLAVAFFQVIIQFTIVEVMQTRL